MKFLAGMLSLAAFAVGVQAQAPSLLPVERNRPCLEREVTEPFKIENGKIRRTEMLGGSAPYHLDSPWRGLGGR